MEKRQQTKVTFHFPTINKTYRYVYPYDLERDREVEAYRTFYETEAPTLFALYGYAPMDVSIKADDDEVARYRSCYQETLWGIFFREGGEPWHGRFWHFTLSLIEHRWREDHRELKQAA